MITICDGENSLIANNDVRCGTCGASAGYACGACGVPAGYACDPQSAADVVPGATIRPPLPAATCQTLVPSGFDASGGTSSPSWPANQPRSASYCRAAAASSSLAACTGWSGATTSMRPNIVGPSTSLKK